MRPWVVLTGVGRDWAALVGAGCSAPAPFLALGLVPENAQLGDRRPLGGGSSSVGVPSREGASPPWLQAPLLPISPQAKGLLAPAAQAHSQLLAEGPAAAASLMVFGETQDRRRHGVQDSTGPLAAPPVSPAYVGEAWPVAGLPTPDFSSPASKQLEFVAYSSVKKESFSLIIAPTLT